MIDQNATALAWLLGLAVLCPLTLPFFRSAERTFACERVQKIGAPGRPRCAIMTTSPASVNLMALHTSPVPLGSPRTARAFARSAQGSFETSDNADHKARGVLGSPLLKEA